MSPNCTPSYAPPEVLDAYLKKRSVAVQASQDMWALGVMAYETICGSRAFPHFGSMDMVLDCGAGRSQYPWEQAEAQLVRLPLVASQLHFQCFATPEYWQRGCTFE